MIFGLDVFELRFCYGFGARNPAGRLIVVGPHRDQSAP
jgi:hypothetical protein